MTINNGAELPIKNKENKMARNEIPSIDQLSKYQVNRVGAVEAVRQTLYDSATYAAGGQTSLTFFQLPVGQGGKTKADTNMEAAGTLPNPKQFLVQSIELHFFPGATIEKFGAAADTGNIFADDVYVFAKGGYLDFFIGSKSYLTEAPLTKFPPKTRLDGWGAASDTTTAGAGRAYRQDYSTVWGRPYYLDPAILLVPTQNFQISLNWPVAVALPSTLAGRVVVSLDGILYRNSQ